MLQLGNLCEIARETGCIPRWMKNLYEITLAENMFTLFYTCHDRFSLVTVDFFNKSLKDLSHAHQPKAVFRQIVATTNSRTTQSCTTSKSDIVCIQADWPQLFQVKWVDLLQLAVPPPCWQFMRPKLGKVDPLCSLLGTSSSDHIVFEKSWSLSIFVLCVSSPAIKKIC